MKGKPITKTRWTKHQAEVEAIKAAYRKEVGRLNDLMSAAVRARDKAIESAEERLWKGTPYGLYIEATKPSEERRVWFRIARRRSSMTATPCVDERCRKHFSGNAEGQGERPVRVGWYHDYGEPHHVPGCRHYERASAWGGIAFRSRADAEVAGHAAGKCCSALAIAGRSDQ